jgi:curved DNA-binding protein CbpA
LSIGRVKLRAPRTYYEILGISQTASAPELKSAYRRLVRQAHPDMGGSSALLDMVNEAYETLKDPFSRAKYDVGVRQGANTAESGSTQEAASAQAQQARQREENERTQQRQREAQAQQARQREENERTQQRQREAQAQQARQREENERTQQRQREDRREAQAQQARNAAEAKRRAKARKRVGALVSFPAVALIWWAATRGGSQPEQPQ